MNTISTTSNADWRARFRTFFTTRDFILHDGRDLRRFSIGGKTQAALATVLAVTLSFSAYGVAQAGMFAASAAGLADSTSPEAQVEAMQAKLEKMKADVAAVKSAAQAHVTKVEQRQEWIAAVLAGRSTPEEIEAAMTGNEELAALTPELRASLGRVEQRQAALAAQAEKVAELRYKTTAAKLRKLGIDPRRFAVKGDAMGGPYEPVDGRAASAEARSDAQFRSLFMTWKKLDSLENGVIAIPSVHPVSAADLRFSSYYGVRSDPFRGSAAMHAGVDIPGPTGTPIYATADGIVERAGRAGGYGNLVEIDHGKGIETRYGHLSKILVKPNQRVKRGQVVALMGSTGRSTGSHLHYEVRIDGRAVNPMPFLQTADYLTALQDKSLHAIPAVAGGVEIED
ncbi:M23 family metallopeptidase [Hephaestia sp. GCM10023244]|uniref:M23 family metallopeptidase n=1 Tax=unclassified Hephaestia TaxID=2631281 RepID=UPI0020778818|nr:M23 family metallopeptidase [Hephaestia sp. MAHUQ-44]MCM8730684.1 M23 family metallopeptidase [Hephaestia sp. MAHUQ-44]